MIGLNKKHIQKEELLQALFNQDKVNDFLRKEIQAAVNQLLEAELTTFLGYDPYAKSGWNSDNLYPFLGLR